MSAEHPQSPVWEELVVFFFVPVPCMFAWKGCAGVGQDTAEG